MLEKLLDRVEKEYRVDKDRVWVTGLSMGGQGTWSLAMACPGRITAIAPICGWADTTGAAAISHMPVWVFHGAKDPVVPLESSAAMVRTLEKLGAPVKFTVYPEAGHDAWTETYADPGFWDWITRQSRKQD
jgi:predicted peptidase